MNQALYAHMNNKRKKKVHHLLCLVHRTIVRVKENHVKSYKSTSNLFIAIVFEVSFRHCMALCVLLISNSEKMKIS
jgi:hypothetical protein